MRDRRPRRRVKVRSSHARATAGEATDFGDLRAHRTVDHHVHAPRNVAKIVKEIEKLKHEIQMSLL